MEGDMTYIIEIYKTDELEFNAEVEVDRWKQFWAYFNTQWMGKLRASWNIHDQDDSTKEFVNRTNNALESYNRRYQNLFPTSSRKVRLAEWVEITEQESRYQAEMLEDIRRGRQNQPKRKSKTINEVPKEYLIFKKHLELENKKKKG